MSECTSPREMANLLKSDTPDNTKQFTEKLQACASLLDNDRRFTQYVAQVKDANWTDVNEPNSKAALMAVDLKPNDKNNSIQSISVEHKDSGNMFQNLIGARAKEDIAFGTKNDASKWLVSSDFELGSRYPMGPAFASKFMFASILAKNAGGEGYILTADVKEKR